MAVIEIDQAASPFALPQVWDRIQIGSPPNARFWPPPESGYSSGKIKISGPKRQYKWDIKVGMGLQGAYETYKGIDLPAFTITFYIWNDALYAAWLQFQPIFEYVPITDPKQLDLIKPVSIYHPMLANLGISQVIVEDIGGVEMVDESARLFASTVTFREFRKPVQIQASTPDAASNGDPALPQNDPQIVRLNQQIAVATTQLNAVSQVGTNPQSIQPPPPPFK